MIANYSVPSCMAARASDTRNLTETHISRLTRITVLLFNKMSTKIKTDFTAWKSVVMQFVARFRMNLGNPGISHDICYDGWHCHSDNKCSSNLMCCHFLDHKGVQLESFRTLATACLMFFYNLGFLCFILILISICKKINCMQFSLKV